MTQSGLHIHITGVVQGVGFRPFIYNLAKTHQLNGWVRNSASGVDIEVGGSAKNITAFLHQISTSAPPLAQIDSIETQELIVPRCDEFKIIHSEDQSSDFIPVSPDVAICEDCKIELLDPQDNRFRYPFINCTNCGPRFSIIEDIPYDRPYTTMSGFEMCPRCRSEYENPTDRRFHAQPIACPDCGPQVWIEVNPGVILAEREAAFKKARQILADGQILAIKGLGGFHLACDASNTQAVTRLRERKGRVNKPFALMAYNIETIAKYVHLSPSAEQMLTSPQAPIVLMPKKQSTRIADEVAPGQANLGFMLPYTPLHILLLEPDKAMPEVLVMTSGNISEEPITHENDESWEKLHHIADAFLMHNRPIHTRIDDSVFAILNQTPYPIRRARGYAPNPIRLAQPLPQVLAVGPQMKNTFCLTREKYAFISHHIGEMDNWETYQDFQKAIQHYETLFRITPEAIGYDLHPDYVSTKYAIEKSTQEHLPCYPIQHHHAHLAAALIENDLPAQQDILGLIFDGTGYGLDDTIWGGEVLLGNVFEFQRVFHLKAVPLPGGEAAILKPARMALSTLWAYGLPWEDHLAPVKAMTSKELVTLKNQLNKSINTPLTSSMGRLFDAISALIGVRETITYEAQAAIELEALADPDEVGYYAWRTDGSQIEIKPLLQAVLQDLRDHVDVRIIAARFHNTIVQLSLEIARIIRQTYSIQQVVLSGGVWQNQFLIRKTYYALEKEGFSPIIHRHLPPNDGCVAFGQALITAYRYMKDKE
jgi:hydrogenase maturation protein HypF